MSENNEGNGSVQPALTDSMGRKSGQIRTRAGPRLQPILKRLRECRTRRLRPKKPPVYKRPLFWIIGGGVLIAAVVIGLLYYLHTRDWEETDDAFIQADVTQVSPRVAGHVQAVYVTDNQDVKQGDKLVALDPADFQARVEESQAAVLAAEKGLVQAQDMVTSAQADVGQSEASEKAAQTEAERS